MTTEGMRQYWNDTIDLPGLLTERGEDLTREGLQDTPVRVRQAWEELLEGYSQDPIELVGTTWDAAGGGLQICRNMFFTSTCEHHLMTFFGHCHIGYEPQDGDDGRVIGLSKMSRIVNCFAHRLQIQERMVNQIADVLNEALNPRALVIVANATHLCCRGRGVQRETMDFVTVAFRGEEKRREIILDAIWHKDHI